MTQSERLKEARNVVSHPQKLAAEFADSVKRFESYRNIEEDFYPKRSARNPSERVTRTNDYVLRLEAQERIVPTEAPGRRAGSGSSGSVVEVPAARLSADYVDRELLVQRTTSPAEWDDGTRNIGGLRLDVLLADAADRTPIVAELKLPGDKDPFFALIQALACAAHLATPNQYKRLRHRYPGVFPELSGPPHLDVWVLLVDSAAARGKYMPDLIRATETLAPALLKQKGISASIRRLGGVRILRPDAKNRIATEVYWAWERPSG